MASFMGTFRNRLDAKGRVSIPAPFRSCLPPVPGEPALVLRPSHQRPCLEGWPAAVFASLAAPLTAFDLFSADGDDMAAALYADAVGADPDREGRIILPEQLVAHAGLSDGVMFVGLGRTFHLWEPRAGEEYCRETRERARERALTLSARPSRVALVSSRPEGEGA